MFCRQQAVQLRGEAPRISALGGELALVGSGSVAEARAFAAREAAGLVVYTDPTLAAFDAAGLVRSVASVMSPVVALRAVRAVAGGATQGRTQGAATQQGGAFVIGTDGALALAFVSRSAGDHPEPAALLAALAGLTGRR